MTDIEFVPILVLGLVVYTLTNLLKYLRARDWNGVVTLLGAWVIGTIAVWIVGATDWASTVTVGGLKTLDMLSWAEKILVGLVITSVGSTVFDLKKSFDNTDSAATPQLVPPPKGAHSA
jgi:uncharacterized membrane protein